MKFNDSLVALVSDFAAVKRTPNYKPATAPVDPGVEVATRKDSVPKIDPQLRRHSLLISVGTEEVPRLSRPRTRSESTVTPPTIDAKLYNKAARRLSAPCVSSNAASASLRKKLQKMREGKATDSDTDTLVEEEEDEVRAHLAERRTSSGSAVYRV